VTRLRDRILPPVVSAVGPGVVRSLAATWRSRRFGADPLAERRRAGTDERYIVGVWHDTLLPLSWYCRNECGTVLVSRHGDGELLVRVLERLGYGVARGSTTRGGAAAMRELLRIARDGSGDFAITPDGPKGPSRRAQAGIGYFAAATGFPILPLTIGVDRAWRLNSWDRFQIPKPGARIAIVAGTPIPVPREASEALDPYLRRFEEEMERAEHIAREHLANGW
jgi:lysophospholipid acyltransferase (LPLAT)-like uncharacterized protein